ncbi:MAG: response regulator transcription factor [Methylococcaceae bacterium]
MTLDSSPNLPRIVVVEDDPGQLLGLLDYLHLVGYPAWGADCSEALYKGLLINPVDVIILDIGLPGEDGLTIAQHLRGLPNLAIIILSARASLDDRIAGLAIGADRYLVKPIDLAELVANIEAVTRSQSFIAAPPIERVKEELKPDTTWRLNSQHWTLTSPRGTMLQLTDREFRVLQILMSVQGQIVDKRGIADLIIGSRILNSHERLDVLLARLRKKAGTLLEDPLPIKTAHQIGYAFTAPAEID